MAGVIFDVDPTKTPNSRWVNPVAKQSLDERFSTSQLQNYDYETGKVVIKGKLIKSTASNKHCVNELSNGFVNACSLAYNQHYPLELLPDNVWLALMNIFAAYVCRHSEALRKKFVDHDGKKKLTVFTSGSLHTVNWDSLIRQMSDLIDQNTKGDIRKFAECDFTTSDLTSKTVSKVVLMSTLKNYFDYGFCLRCGLPKVRLGGTLEDWIKISQRAERFVDYDVDGTLTKWVPQLRVVLQQIGESYKQGSVGPISNDLKQFWSSIVHHEGGGSGPTYLSGWILTFIPFDKSGEFVLDKKIPKIDTTNIPNGFCDVPVTIDDNGDVHECTFYSGQFMAEYQGGFVRPSIDWLMVEDNEPVNKPSNKLDNKIDNKDN